MSQQRKFLKRITRRRFLSMAAATGSLVAMPTAAKSLLALGYEDPYTLEEVRQLLPKTVSRSIAALITRTLNLDPTSLNINWDAAGQVEGLLLWSKHGLLPGIKFANSWLDHVRNSRHLTDEEFNEVYKGEGRVIRTKQIIFSLYCGNFAVTFPSYLLHRQIENGIIDPKESGVENETTRAVCISVAEAILHYAARDRYGMVAHDDHRVCQLSIPDVGYFAVRPLAIASTVASAPFDDIFLKQALFQAGTYFDIFFDAQKGLTQTGIFNGERGKTYWTRASGWLIWMLTSLLRHLPERHPEFDRFTGNLKQMADGLARVQGTNGGLRVWLDDESSPEEVTGTSMCVSAIHEGMRKGWLSDDYIDFVDRGWEFIQRCVTDEGKVVNAYTGWAVPAERKKLDMDRMDRGFIDGMVLKAANEMMRGKA